MVWHAQFFGIIGQHDFAADLVHPASGAIIEQGRGQRVAGAAELGRVGVETYRHQLVRLGRNGDFVHRQPDVKAVFRDCFLDGQVELDLRVSVVCHPDLPCLLPWLGQGQRAKREGGQPFGILRLRRHGGVHRLCHVEKSGPSERLGVDGAVFVQHRIGGVEQQRLDLDCAPAWMRLLGQGRRPGDVRQCVRGAAHPGVAGAGSHPCRLNQLARRSDFGFEQAIR